MTSEVFSLRLALQRLCQPRMYGLSAPHCTLAVTVAFPLNVNVQVLVLLPLLEHAPDQTTLRPLVALNVIVIGAGNEADPLLPTATLMLAGLEVTEVPLRPVAVTVSIAVWPAGVRVNVAL